MIKSAHILYLILLCISLSSCKKEETLEPEAVEESPNEFLVEYELVAEHSKSTLQGIATFIGFGEVSDEIKYDVKVYTATYSTTYNDSNVVASGLIIVPQEVSGEIPLMSINHGTIFANENAPSDYETVSEKELLAATGYMTVMPDYIGYGTTASILHPYYHKQNITTPVIDMIKAGKEFAEDEEIEINRKLFMFGYSEGGYVTMATHQAIEAMNDPKFKVTASALGAGGYDLIGVLDELLDEPTYASPNYLAFIVHSYNTTNNWRDPLSNYFNEPYATDIPTLFNGEYDSGEINAQLTNDLSSLLNSDFIDTLTNKYDSKIISELTNNSVHDWLPMNPIRMYHGTNDAIVPFNDSQNTYDGFKNNGVANVEFVPIAGGTHGSSIIDMAKDAVYWFKAFQIP